MRLRIEAQSWLGVQRARAPTSSASALPANSVSISSWAIFRLQSLDLVSAINDRLIAFHVAQLNQLDIVGNGLF